MYATVLQSVKRYVPERVVTNDDLAKWMETSDTWIRERTGIGARRFVEEGTPTSTIALKAARSVLEERPDARNDIDLIIASTLSPDLYFPGLGTLLQNGLALGTVPALDIRAQCSGLVYGLATADAYIRSGLASCILLVCAEVQSPVLDMSTQGRDMAVLFGDGAGALLITRVETEEAPSAQNNVRGVIDSHMGSDGSGAELLCLKAPGTATPGFLRPEDLTERNTTPKMDGRQVFKHAVHRMCESAELLLKRNGIRGDDVDLLLPHQANLRINEVVREKLGIPPEKAINTIEQYGNTTSATIPISMAEAEMAGKLQRGDLVLTLAFGAGFTWGGNLIRW